MQLWQRIEYFHHSSKRGYKLLHRSGFVDHAGEASLALISKCMLGRSQSLIRLTSSIAFATALREYLDVGSEAGSPARPRPRIRCVAFSPHHTPRSRRLVLSLMVVTHERHPGLLQSARAMRARQVNPISKRADRKLYISEEQRRLRRLTKENKESRYHWKEQGM